MAHDDLATRITVQAEEQVNTWLNRPQASLFVSFFYRFTNVSANQVTFMAIIAGILSGLAIACGSRDAIFVGGLLYQLSIVLDCADGQLARLKGTSSEFGRILDGISDYIVGIAVFGGTIYALLANFDALSAQAFIPYTQDMIIPLTILCFVSTAIHAIAYDFVKTKFTSIVKTGTDQTVKEKLELERRYAIEAKTLSAGKRCMLRLYISYNNLQRSLLSFGAFEKLQYSQAEREAILAERGRFLRLWSFLGPNSHMIVIVLAAMLGDLMLAIWITVIPFNLYYLLMLVLTKSGMKKKVNTPL